MTHLDIDLDTMSLEELRTLRGQVDRAITQFEGRRRKEALAAAERAARDLGFNLAELTGQGSARGRRSAGSAPAGEAKYAHPDDKSQTWSGRGRRPRWIAEQLEAGRTLDDLLI